MSKARVIVLSVIEQGLTKAEAARRFDVTWQWVHTLVQRYEANGLDGLEPRSRRPRSNPTATPEHVRTRIIELREKLTIDGLDAGPATIAWHLHTEGIDPPPAVSTIRRVLLDAGLVRPEPRKRPRSSLRRFAAEQPNETWQSDFTYWTLADGTDAQILNWLDDHSRYLLSCTAHTKVTGTDVTSTFTATINTYGPPASTTTSRPGTRAPPRPTRRTARGRHRPSRSCSGAVAGSTRPESAAVRRSLSLSTSPCRARTSGGVPPGAACHRPARPRGRSRFSPASTGDPTATVRRGGRRRRRAV
jgi:transposase InsO family protein